MRRWPSFLALLLTACSSGPTLTVLVRTDFAPTTEFVTVQVMVETAPRAYTAMSGDDWFHGVKVATFGGMTVGSHDVRASLLDATGRAIASRHVILTFAADYTLTVELTRTCAALHCPGTTDPPNATECLGSRCVDPHCGGTDSAACPPDECSTASSCPAPVASCAIASCDHGLCLYAADDSLCTDPTPLCDLARGCVAMITPLDAGPPDLGLPDLGPPDLGPPDLGPMDLGVDMARFCFSSGDCSDSNSCTTDDCVLASCRHASAPDGTHCDAGAVCGGLGAPTCMSGVCTPSPFSMSCDDHNPCTDDRCSTLAMTCRHSANTGAPCTYGDAGCPSTCNVGVCTAIPGC